MKRLGVRGAIIFFGVGFIAWRVISGVAKHADAFAAAWEAGR